jgi:sulfur relay protein TusB/DsrH
MATLHIVNTSTPGTGALTNCLHAASPGDAVLLIGNGVYVAVAATFARHRPKHGGLSWFALAADVRARGMADRLATDVAQIDDEAFVDLVAAHRPIVSWSG